MVNGKPIMRWLRYCSPFTIYRLLLFRYAPCAMLYAILPGPKDQVFVVK
jgi:hypothetical protein